jgi:PAS domain S-box-containing protein
VHAIESLIVSSDPRSERRPGAPDSPSAARRDTQLQFIVDAVPALIAYVDSEERYRFNNHAYEEWFQRPPSEVLGRTVREVVGEEAYAAALPRVRAALAGQLVTFEESLLYPGGKLRHVKATYAPDVGEDGRVRGFGVLVTDITDHKRAEAERAELRRRNEELARAARSLRESADIAAVARGIGESILPLFGAEAAVLWLLEPDGGLACVAFAGRWLTQFKPGDILPRGVGLVGRAVLERRAIWTSDLVNEPAVILTEDFRRSVASAGHHAVAAVPLQVKGTIIGAMSTAHLESRTFSQGEIDLLQAFADQAALAIWNVQLLAREQAARSEAEAANRAKDQFLALLAHELRNPLAPILTAAVVMRRAGAPPAIQRSAGIVERQASHLARLLDDLLDVSRITRGTIELRREPVALQRALADALETTRPQIEAREHEVSLSLPPAPLRVDADPTRLEQILVNILSNAVKYTPPKGRISVSVAEHTGEAVLRVRDTGTGISAEMLPRIFDLFTQGDQSLAHSSGGLGVGLTLVRRLVELHGGRVAAHSDGPGRGSEFTIRLPLSARSGGSDEAKRVARDRCPVCSVLIVEDNVDAQQTLRMLLEDEGHRVDVASDGPGGLARTESTPFDVVLVDIGLPAMDGYEVARRIRASNPTTILVAVSGYGQAEDRQRSLEAGFDAHLTKPVSPDHLVLVLATLLRNRGRSA